MTTRAEAALAVSAAYADSEETPEERAAMGDYTDIAAPDDDTGLDWECGFCSRGQCARCSDPVCSCCNGNPDG